MLNNLERAKLAIGGKKEFKITIEEKKEIEIIVTGKDKAEATNNALKEYNNDNSQKKYIISGSSNVTNTEETTTIKKNRITDEHDENHMDDCNCPDCIDKRYEE